MGCECDRLNYLDEWKIDICIRHYEANWHLLFLLHGKVFYEIPEIFKIWIWSVIGFF